VSWCQISSFLHAVRCLPQNSQPCDYFVLGVDYPDVTRVIQVSIIMQKTGFETSEHCNSAHRLLSLFVVDFFLKTSSAFRKAEKRTYIDLVELGGLVRVDRVYLF
jgi:hypothetical protein